MPVPAGNLLAGFCIVDEVRLNEKLIEMRHVVVNENYID